MLTTIGLITLLFGLFYLLGRVADRIVTVIVKISHGFGIKMFFMGIILAFFTSLPEFSIGINAIVNNVPDISLGNFLGSLLVVYGLVLGASLILNRRIRTDGKISHFAPVLMYLFLPFLFAMDGTVTRLEGFLLVLWYCWVIYFLYNQHGKEQKVSSHPRPDRAIVRDSFIVLICLVLMIAFSAGIIQITDMLLKSMNVHAFVVGLLLFSIGTNLPEIMVMIHSWKSGMKELSMSHLMGSVIFDPLLVGIFAIIKPFQFSVTLSYYILFFFAAFLLIVLAGSYITDKQFDRREGWMLLGIYFCFVASQIGIEVLG